MPHVDLDRFRLHYEVEGPGDASALVLSHSIGANLSMWDFVAPALATRYKVVRYDTRGHGSSGTPSGPYSIADLGRDAVALLDALNIDRCCFCGLSLGGMIGLWLGIHTPQRVERLILANTAARIGTLELWNERIRQVREGGLASMTDAILARWFTPQFRQHSPAIMESVRGMLASTSSEGYAACCAAIRDEDLSTSLHAIAAPALVITGAEDPATPPRDGQFLAERIPHAKLVELATSHLSAIEYPAGFSSAVLDFLGGQEG